MEEASQEGFPSCSAAEPKVATSAGCNSHASTVTLNVGGQLFTTLVKTLRRDPESILAKLDQQECPRDAQGNIFIDRDPQHFGLVMNYLRDGFVVMPRGEESLREIMVEAAHYKLAGLREAVMPHGGWRPNYATHMRASTMHQLRGDKLALKGALDLVLFCAYGDKGRGWPGSVSQVHLVVYDFAEHVGDALAFTPPTVPVLDTPSQSKGGGRADFSGQPMYTRLKQSCMFRGAANSRWFETTHELRHRLMGEAPHLMDPEELDSKLLLEDGRQRGLYELPSSGSSGRSPMSTAEFTDSIFEVYRQCTASLPKEERELRESALYVIANLSMVRLALQLCDFKDVSLSIEAKHVPREEWDRSQASNEYPVFVLYDVRLAVALTL